MPKHAFKPSAFLNSYALGMGKATSQYLITVSEQAEAWITDISSLLYTLSTSCGVATNGTCQPNSTATILARIFLLAEMI